MCRRLYRPVHQLRYHEDRKRKVQHQVSTSTGQAENQTVPMATVITVPATQKQEQRAGLDHPDYICPLIAFWIATMIPERDRTGLPVDEGIEQSASPLKAGCVQEFLHKRSTHPSTRLALNIL